jgi:AMP nucleosidase
VHRTAQIECVRVDQHLQIGVKVKEILRTNGLHKLHSRKLRSFAEVAFQ